MAIQVRQTDTVGNCGIGVSTTRVMEQGGVAGTTPIDSGNVSAGTSLTYWIRFEFNNDPALSWDAGTVVSRLNVTSGDTTMEISEIVVSRFSSACSDLEQLASIAPNTPMGAGVITHNISIPATTPNATDKLVIDYAITSTAPHGNSAVSITPDQLVDLPFSAAVINKTETDVGSGTDEVVVTNEIINQTDSGSGSDIITVDDGQGPTVDTSSPLYTNLVCFNTFHEGSGITAEDISESTSQHNLTLGDSASWTTFDGKSVLQITQNGTTPTTIPDHPDLGDVDTISFSFDMWVQYTDNNSVWNMIVSHGHFPGWNIFWAGWDGHLRVRMGSVAYEFDPSDSDVRATTGLNHIAVTYNGSTQVMNCYVNGTLLTGSPVDFSGNTSSMDSANDVQFAGNADHTVNFGRFRYWDARELTSSEVSTLSGDYDALLVTDGGGGDTTITVSDTGSGAEQNLIDSQATVSDSLTTEDSISIGNVGVGISDAGDGLSEISISNSTVISDEGAGDVNLNINVSSLVSDDITAISDIFASVQALVDDSSTGLDSLSVLKEKIVELFDTAQGTDSLVVSIENLLIEETSIASDELSIIRDKVVELVETAQGSDSVIASVDIALQDTSIASDELSIIRDKIVQLLDVGQGTDSLAVSVENILIEETSITSDELSIIRDKIVQLSENIQGNDEISVSIENILIEDTSLGLDELSVIKEKVVQILETAQGSDSLDISVETILQESGVGSDELSIIRDKIVQLTETAQGSDELSISVESVLHDTSIASDEISLLRDKIVQILETAQGNDELFISVETLLEEVGVGSDNLSVIKDKIVQILETAQGSDSLEISVETILQESGVGSDEISLLRDKIVQLIETAQGSDSLDISVETILQDTSLGLDELSVIKEKIVQILETAQGNDSLAVSVETILQESGVGSDEISLLRDKIVQLIETAQGDDNVSVSIGNILIEDSSIGLDDLSILRAKIIQLIDNAIGSDSLSISVDSIIDEFSNADDNIALQDININISDNGSFDDRVELSVVTSVNDTSSISDSISIIKDKIVSIIDSVDGVDDVSLTTDIALSDDGYSSEYLQIQHELSITDFGSGVEYVSSFDPTVNIVKIEFKFTQRSDTGFRFREGKSDIGFRFMGDTKLIEFELSHRTPMEFSFSTE